mgnify:CR=1 FL=1
MSNIDSVSGGERLAASPCRFPIPFVFAQDPRSSQVSSDQLRFCGQPERGVPMASLDDEGTFRGWERMPFLTECSTKP